MSEGVMFVGLADAILWFHVGVVLFNVFGLVVVPIGAWRGWEFVRIFWWQALHLAMLALVAIQAVFGRACFLTIWQSDLLQRAGQAGSSGPFNQRWATRLIFWPLPLWFFVILYLAVLVYALALWWLVPPRRRRRPIFR
jgi:Protein of Unknown function (DUF2784)